MTNDPGKNWRELCIAAAFEIDPERLLDLVTQINGCLATRQEQLTDEIFGRLATEPQDGIGKKRWLN